MSLRRIKFLKIHKNAPLPGYITQLYFSKYGYPMDTSYV